MKFGKLLRKFVRDDRGLELVEYAVMAALIVAALITAIVGLSGAIQGRFSNVQGQVESH